MFVPIREKGSGDEGSGCFGSRHAPCFSGNSGLTLGLVARGETLTPCPLSLPRHGHPRQGEGKLPIREKGSGDEGSGCFGSPHAPSFSGNSGLTLGLVARGKHPHPLPPLPPAHKHRGKERGSGRSGRNRQVHCLRAARERGGEGHYLIRRHREGSAIERLGRGPIGEGGGAWTDR